MAAIDKVAGQHRPYFDDFAELTAIAAAAITAGDAIYMDSTGKFDLADSDAAATGDVLGIALSTVAAGQACSIQIRGTCHGYDLSSVDPGTIVYVSGTAGGLDTTRPSASLSLPKSVGRVVLLPNSQKALLINPGADTVANV